MKLLIFIHSLSSGGAERVTANLANYWAAKGWQVTVVTLACRSHDFYVLEPAVHRVAPVLSGDSGNPVSAIVNNLRRVVTLRRVLRQEMPNVALAMMSTANILLALAAIGLKGVATVGSERTHPPQYPLGAVWEVLRAKLYAPLTAVVALTEMSATWLRQNTRARRIAVIPNAAHWPLPEQPPHLEPPRKRNGQLMLLAVGRLSEEKCFDLLIAVFQQLFSEFPDWRLVILGEGPSRLSLEAQIESFSLGDRVALPGRVGNVGQWYAAADLYVMSSRFEGFPNTLAEAMAHGVPAVSFDCDTGPRDIIRHETDGLLVPAGNRAALEEALRKLMNDGALRERFAERAIEVRHRFSLERIAGMWERLFEEIDIERTRT